MADEISPQMIDDLKTELRSEMTKKFAGWAIAGGLGVLGLAALGAWTVLKPQISANLGIVSKKTIEDMIEVGTNGLATQDAVVALSEAMPDDEHIRNVASGATSIPVGAVVAFDGGAYELKSEADSAQNGCPSGWIRFKQAEGRFILGSDADWTQEGQFVLRKTGGTPTHTLTIEDLPDHSHTTQMIKTSIPKIDSLTNTPKKPDDTGFHYLRSGTSALSVRTGGFNTGREHNQRTLDNMPPYIALYFCKKEGS